MLLTLGVLIAAGIALIQIKSVFYGEQDISKQEVINQFANDIDSIIDKCSSTTGNTSFDYNPSIKKYKLEVKDNVITIQDRLTNKTVQFVKTNINLKDTTVIDSRTIHVSKNKDNVFIIGRCLEAGEECSSSFVCCNKYCWGDSTFICQNQCADNGVRAADDESCCSGFLNKTTGLCDVPPFCPTNRVCHGAPEAEIIGGEDCCPMDKPICTGGHCCPSDKPKWCNNPTNGEPRCMSETEFENNCESIGICSGPLPDHFDWRDVNGENWLTPVKDQGGCGSCWAFATVGAIEAVYNIERGNPDLDLDLSEQNLVSSCLPGNSCDGGWHDEASQYIKTKGIVDESCFPYQSWNCGGGRSRCSPHCICNRDCCNPCSCSLCSDWNNRLYKINNIKWIRGRENIKRALVCHGPLPTVIDVYCALRGIPAMMPNHAVVIVGYDDNGGYWIIRNSWGTRHPYFNVKYGECFVEDYVLSVYGIS